MQLAGLLCEVARRGPKKGSTPTKSPPKRMAPGVERTGNTPSAQPGECGHVGSYFQVFQLCDENLFSCVVDENSKV